MEKINKVEVKKDLFELSTEKDEASEVAQLSCIADNVVLYKSLPSNWMIWNNFADLNRIVNKKQQ
jgi:hypothetical protein